MKTLEEIKRILAEHKEELRKLFGVKEIGIFGSYVRNEQTELSDVDILVDFEREIGWEIVDLRDYLEKLLNVKVDLVSKKGIVRKPLLWKHVKEEIIYV
nr:nucleotidyltransferase family protein [Ferroglobus sp.]